MIDKTLDYSMFKKHPRNRPIDEANIRKIMHSIGRENLLKRRPIEVNENFEVMDGQHRLEVANRLGLEVYYEIKEDMLAHHICLLNDNQKGWNKDDYLHYQASGGNENYIQLQSFINHHKFPLTRALIALGLGGGGGNTQRFIDGHFLFPSSEEMIEVTDILEKSEFVVEYLTSKTIDMKAYFSALRFYRGLYVFLSLKSVEFDTFKKKLSQRMDHFRPVSRLRDLLKIIQEIYNWKNKKPVDFEEETEIDLRLV